MRQSSVAIRSILAKAVKKKMKKSGKKSVAQAIDPFRPKYKLKFAENFFVTEHGEVVKIAAIVTRISALHEEQSKADYDSDNDGQDGKTYL